MAKKKSNTIRWTCPDCGKIWISSIKKQWYGKCYACDGIFTFTNKSRKDLKWKFIKDKDYEVA